MLGRLGLLMTGEDGGIQEISMNISDSVIFINATGLLPDSRIRPCFLL